MSTIAYCAFVHNDLPMLRSTIIHDMQWVDQICILDMGSTDGTREFCESIIGPNDRYVRRDYNTCPHLGFAEAHNAAFALATTDWIYAGAASYCMGWGQDIKAVIDASMVNSISAETRHVNPMCVDGKYSLIERATALAEITVIEQHIILLRRRPDLNWRGYIHSEPYIGDKNSREFAEQSTLYRWHFQAWGDNILRCGRNAWMLRQAIRNPELQQWTHPWWYQTFWPNTREALERMADEYEAMGVDKQT